MSRITLRVRASRSIQADVVISPATIATPVLTMVSQATRAPLSWARMASRTASEIWSAILSGWPSETDSEVNRVLDIGLISFDSDGEMGAHDTRACRRVHCAACEAPVAGPQWPGREQAPAGCFAGRSSGGPVSIGLPRAHKRRMAARGGHPGGPATVKLRPFGAGIDVGDQGAVTGAGVTLVEQGDRPAGHEVAVTLLAEGFAEAALVAVEGVAVVGVHGARPDHHPDLALVEPGLVGELGHGHVSGG